MPRATCKYRFEWKIWDWATRFSHTLTSHNHYAFLVLLTEDGRTSKIIVGDRPEHFDHQEFEAWRQEAPSWLFYDPFEGPVYTCIQWQNVERGTMERLIGATIEPDDLISDGVAIEFPTSWSVIF